MGEGWDGVPLSQTKVQNNNICMRFDHARQFIILERKGSAYIIKNNKYMYRIAYILWATA